MIDFDSFLSVYADELGDCNENGTPDDEEVTDQLVEAGIQAILNLPWAALFRKAFGI